MTVTTKEDLPFSGPVPYSGCMTTLYPLQVLAVVFVLLHLVTPLEAYMLPGRTLDCRYEVADLASEPGEESSGYDLIVPRDDVFRPLLADMKEPRFYGSWRRTRFDTTGMTVREDEDWISLGAVGVGGRFGLWSRRQQSTCNGYQVGIEGGVFSQFNLTSPGKDLLNSDYVVGLPVTYRRDRFSARLRIFHQSSHLGDEFMIKRPEIVRRSISFEGVDLVVSAHEDWWRFYGGPGYIFNTLTEISPWYGRFGMEFFGAPFTWGMPGRSYLYPVGAVDVSSYQDHGWSPTTSIKAGLDWSVERHFRILFAYLRGFNPFSQFFTRERVENYGIELQFEF